MTLRASPDLPRITADDGQLRQVIVGLLMNALDAVEPKGHVTVETARVGDDRVSLTVQDDGRGIAPEDMPNLFTPFFTRKKTGSGLGMGLAVCHGIRVDSAPGHGTRVCVVLPRSAARAAP